MTRFKTGWVLLLIISMSPAVHAACRVDDDDAFASTDGGCKDLSTGLVWGTDIRIWGFPNGTAQNYNYCNDLMNQNPANGGGFTDWRVPTVEEIHDSLANGLNSHLDFFLDGSPDDFKYRWTACTQRIKGISYRYMVRFADGHTDLPITIVGRPDTHLICVRGLPADLRNDCPGKPGKGSRSGAANALSQTSTGTLLLLPLAVVLATRCLKARRP
jgi:hypothetical protein